MDPVFYGHFICSSACSRWDILRVLGSFKAMHPTIRTDIVRSVERTWRYLCINVAVLFYPKSSETRSGCNQWMWSSNSSFSHYLRGCISSRNVFLQCDPKGYQAEHLTELISLYLNSEVRM